MKRRIWFGLGILVAILVAWQMLSKPRSIVKQFYMVGVRVQHLKSVKTKEGSDYIYSTPLKNRETIVDVLDRAGYQRDPNSEVFTIQHGSFSKSETRRISIAPKGDKLEIVANFPI
jgi:hypothetical protein